MSAEHDKESVKVAHEASIKKKTKVPDDRVTEEDIFRESVQGLGIMSDDEDYQTDEEEVDQSDLPIKRPIRAEDRKDKKERRKEKRQLLQTIR